MGKKLLLKIIPFWALLLIPYLVSAQCNPTVIIESDDADNKICAGASISFEATPSTDAGSNILYQWRINGINQGSTSSSNTFSSSNIQNGNVVSVRITSDCTSGPVASNNLSITVHQIPTITGVTPEEICGSGSVNLSASASSGTINWYTNETGGSALSSGPNYNPNISSTTTYYVDATANGCTTDTRTAVVATVKEIPTITGTTIGSVCGSGTVNLSATASAGTLSWYANPSGGSSLGSGSSFTTPNISSTTSYYVEATEDGCTSSNRTEVIATVNPSPSITSVTAGNNCGSGSVNLSAISSSGTINWYSNATGGTSLGTGPTFNTPNISSTTTYYVDATENGCITPSRTAVEATIKAIPTITGTTPGSTCGGGSVTLQATSSVGTINWYANPSGGSILGSGSTFNTPNISTSTIYYVDATDNGCTTASRTAIEATVKTIPTITGTTPGNVCGSGSVSLQATVSAGTINWYANETGGSSLGSGTTFNTPNLSATTTYYIDATEDSCTTTNRTPIVATVNPIPTITATIPGSRCLSGSVSLGATASAGTVNWYTSATGGSSIATGATFDPDISTTTSYYVDATNNGCTTTSRTEVIATVNAIPTITSVTPGSRCDNGPVNLSATASAGTINWYANASGGTILATGPNYSPNINSTTTFYVSAVDGACTSASRTPVQASKFTGNPSTGSGNNTASKPTGPTSICPPATGLIYNIPSNMTQNAESYSWNLPPGFEITSGAGTKQITVSVPGNGAVTGNQDITVSANSPCGTSGSSRALTVNIGSFAAVDAGPDTSLCLDSSGNSSTILQNTLSGNATNVSWSVVSGSGSISGGPYGTADFIYTQTGTGSATLRATTNVPVGGGCPNVAGTDDVVLTFNEAPEITSQPTVEQIICSGSTANFSVTATGTGLAYQWQKDGVDISGENNPSLSLSNVTTDESGDYTVVVSGTDPCTDITSEIANLVVNQIVEITAQPVASQTLCSGSTADFSVTATGTGLKYQWQKDGADIPGEINQNLSIADVSTTDSGDYTVVVSGTDPCTDITSEIASLVVNEIVEITTQPTASQVLCSGSTANFSVTAAGTGLTYQWQKDGANIPGEINQTLSIADISTTDSGDYTVVVSGTDPCSDITSDTANLVVNEIVEITTQPTASEILCSGSTAEFSVTATGTGLTYQWQKDGVAIPGENNQTLSIADVSTTDSGEYTVVVSGTDPCSDITSDIANLVVNEIVEITTQPTASQVLCSGSSADFSVTATGTGLTYQWQKDGVAIPGENNQTLSIADVSTIDSGEYTVVVSGTDPCSDITSDIANLVVNEIVEITTQPTSSQTVCAGFSATMTIEATGTGLTYEWFLDGVSTGVTTATYNINNSNMSDAGEYTVVVSGASPCSQVTSDSSILEVNQTIAIDTQPSDSAICEGQNTSLSITATGTDLTYEWRKDGIPLTNGASISGVYTSSLNFTSTELNDSGSYDVIVSGAAGICEQIISNPAILTVDSFSDDPIESTASEETICLGESTELNLLGGGGGTNETIQWYKDSCDGIPVGSGNSLSVSPTETTTYYGRYENSAPCSSNSACASITIIVNLEDTLVLGSAAGTESQNLCINNTLIDIIYNVGGGATSASITEGTLPDGVTGTYNSGVFTIKGTATNSGAFDYTITTNGPCEIQSLSGSITITPLPTANFSYDASPYCNNVDNPLPTMAEEASKGIFSSTAGLVFVDNTTGEINLSATTPGNYTISNTIAPAGGCIQVTETAEITITALPIADFYYDGTPYCSDANNPSVTLGTGATHGVYTSTAGLVFADNSTGEIDMAGSTPGSYTVTNTFIAAGGCEEVQATADIVITKLPIATFSYTGIDDNNATCISVLGLTLENAPDAGGTFSSTTLSSYLNATTGQLSWDLAAPITSGDHTVTYTIPAGNGCLEVTHSEIIKIDAIPQGGNLKWSNAERIFLTCEVQTNDLNEVLTLNDETGEVIEWEYRKASNLNWAPYDSQDGSLTNSDFLSILGVDVETTIFRARIGNGACESGVYSQTAILSVIPSDIKPEPVQATPEVLCYGNEITLSSEIKYVSEFGKFDGGDFTDAGIKNNGWDFTDPNGNEIPYDANANNGTPIHWHKTQPKWRFTTADIDSPYSTSEQWWNPRNDGKTNEHFAIAQSTYSSNMDTPPFNLLSTDEAVLTFDQAFNLTTDATIRVVLLKNGVEYKELYKVTGSASSGFYDQFGYGTPDVNQMSIDLGSYIGESNLRVRFEYRGVRLGDIWAVDNIKVPEGPQNVLLQWFYDDKDPNTTELEQIGLDNESTVSFTPRKIGWNDFEVKTALILDSNGDPCEDINNSETIRVFVFDQYNTSVVAEIGECGNTIVNLSATITGDFQGDVTSDFNSGEFKTIDGYTGSWVIEGPNDNYTLTDSDSDDDLNPVNNPEVRFEAEDLGDYSFTYQLSPTAVYPDDYKDESLRGQPIVNTGCPPNATPNEITLPECTTLDFDGINDYISINDVFAEAQTFEMWIYPEAATGTIISGPGIEITMADLTGYITPNTRWYHIALLGNKLYIDGIDSGSTINATSTGNQTLIGANWNNAKEPENHFSGWIEEVRIWKTLLDPKEIRFMMNQRLDLSTKANGADVQGEVVPNKPINGSYYTGGGFNLDQDGKAFYNENWNDLIAYYRLISAEPDPILGIIPDTYKPVAGYSPDLALTAVDARLHNMTTHQQNTSPTPYLSWNDGDWININTWARNVWSLPNSIGINGSTPIEWNIARINHNIQSTSKDITMLGLLSETADKVLDINPSQFIRISHYLLLDGNIDLEGESQLLQDHGSILDNDSDGWLEANQQGKLSSFNYNYWSSPVSNQRANNNFGYNLGTVLFDGDKEDSQISLIL